MTLGYTTNPLRVGAPLPEETVGIVPVSIGHVRAELLRAEVELMHAIAKHRKAWAAMRKWAVHRDQAANTPGGLCAIEADPVWKKRTGDVTWWRGEMEAQAAVVGALRAMLSSPFEPYID